MDTPLNEEQAAINELKAMTKDELMMVDHSKFKWICHAKKCHRATHVMDFGIYPECYWRGNEWVNLNNNFFLCARHYKLFKRLLENYGTKHIYRRMMDFTKQTIKPIEEKKPRVSLG